MRLALLSTLAWLVHLTDPVFSLGASAGALDLTFSWRDLILIAGGLFLLWKATKEIHGAVDPKPSDFLDKTTVVATNFGAVIFQIILIDMVFSVDSILTAVGMTDHLPIMVTAVIITVIVMLVAADPLANFINENPSVVMLALGFLLMIGMVLVADGFGVHIPKGYIYAAMAFSVGVEVLNIIARNAKTKKEGAAGH
jgi:predicted tellurium resistance membrane protein TerC